MEALPSLAESCATHGLTADELAVRARLDLRRARAMVAGQWTPSPQERDRVAALFGLTRDQIAWTHRTSVQHIYGHGPQFGRSP